MAESHRVSRRRDWRLGAFGALLGFALLEAALRMIGIAGDKPRFATEPPLQASRWVSHPFLPYAGRPNAVLEYNNDEAQTHERIESNSYGFRSHEFETRRPGDFVVLCLGGSTTYGFAAPSNRDTWPERLETKLAARYPQRRIRVYNLSLDMATSAISVVNMALIGVHLHPDLVIVYEGYNDQAAMGAVGFRPDHSHFYHDFEPSRVFAGVVRSVPTWMLSSYVVAYAARASDAILRSNDLARVARRSFDYGPDRMQGLSATLQNLATIHSVTASVGGETLFSTFQFRDGDSTDCTRLNQALRAWFDRRGFWYVDQDRLIPDHDASLQIDECHFTPKGDDLLAENFFQAIVARDLAGKPRSP